MRLTMLGYEVEIKAKSVYGEHRFNQGDTKALLNIIASDLFELGSYYYKSDEKVYRDCAPIISSQGGEIFDFLNSLGYYDNVRRGC